MSQMKSLAAIGLLSASALLHADVVMDSPPISTSVPGTPLDNFEPFPDCINGASNTEMGLLDCPTKTMVRGFDVRISSQLSGGAVPLILEWLTLADAVLLELENAWHIRGHFVSGLRHAGVSFYLSPPVGDGSTITDPYAGCPPNSGCYRAGKRIVEDQISVSRPSNINWGSMRNFMIHELAHAYHDLMLEDGFGNNCVRDAYRFSVRRDGLHANTYAATNHLEYFAQMVSYAMRVPGGAYCSPDPAPCPDGLIIKQGYRASPNLPVQNKWLLAEYDFNGAALFDAFLDPEGHLDRYYPWNPDPLLHPLAPERSRNCDPTIWWPE